MYIASIHNPYFCKEEENCDFYPCIYNSILYHFSATPFHIALNDLVVCILFVFSAIISTTDRGGGSVYKKITSECKFATELENLSRGVI